MRNPSLSKLLRAIGEASEAANAGTKLIYDEAAIELEKLEKIYKYCEENKHSDMGLFEIKEILYEAP